MFVNRTSGIDGDLSNSHVPRAAPVERPPALGTDPGYGDAQRYLEPGGPAEYVRAGRQDVARVAMVEEQEAVADVAAILAAPDLDAVFGGRGDLSLSMGVPGGSPAVHDAVTRPIAAAVAADVPVGTVVQGTDQVRLRAEQGCRFVVLGNDTGMFGGAARAAVATCSGLDARTLSGLDRQTACAPRRRRRALRRDAGPGDIVLLRTGFAEEWVRRTPAQRAEPRAGATGLDQSEEMVAWLWDHRVALMASDNGGLGRSRSTRPRAGWTRTSRRPRAARRTTA